jgi:hypothetical protein
MFTQLHPRQHTARAPTANHARAASRALAINHSRTVVSGRTRRPRP